MVRIGVVSDTHRDFRNLWLAQQAMGKIDWLIHAGDHIQDAYKAAKEMGIASDRLLAVCGNCDYPAHEPAQAFLEVEGVKIWLTHGHQWGVKQNVDRLYYRAQELGARVVVFGHTHVAVAADDGLVLMLNPGSLSQPRMPHDLPSCALLEVRDGQVAAQILQVNG